MIWRWYFMFFLNIIYRWPPENYTTSLLKLYSHTYILTIRVFSDTCNLILLFKSSTKSGDFANDSVNKCQMHHSLTTAKRFVHLYATLNALMQLICYLYHLICKCSWTDKWIGKGNISFDHQICDGRFFWRNFWR